MNNSKTATQKHMTLDDRISIEKGLDQHLSLRSIALQLGKDPTTISKEIKKHRSFQEHNRFNEPANKCALAKDCNGVQREHNKKLNNGLPILHKVPPKRDYGRYFCIMAEKGGTSHGGLTEKLSLFFHAKKQEVNAYGR